MSEAWIEIVPSLIALAALAAMLFAGLRGWQGWLEIKRLELSSMSPRRELRGPAAERIEIADLKERIRKLETLAAGIDL